MLKTVGLAAILAGTLDLVVNMVLWDVWKQVPPMAICQTVASGLFGSAAYAGGVATAVAGVAAEFVMTFAMAWVLYVLTRRYVALQRHWIATAVVYGLVLYVVMNFVVVPLSAAHRPMPWPITWDFKFWFNIFCHVVIVAMTFLLVFRASRSRRTVVV